MKYKLQKPFKRANELTLSLDTLNTSLKLHAVTDPAESIYLQQIFRPTFFVSKKVPLGTNDVNFSFFTYFANKGKIMIASAFHLKFGYSEKKSFRKVPISAFQSQFYVFISQTLSETFYFFH